MTTEHTPETDALEARMLSKGVDLDFIPVYAGLTHARQLERQRDALAEVVRALLTGRDTMDGRLLVDENSPLIDAARAALAKLS